MVTIINLYDKVGCALGWGFTLYMRTVCLVSQSDLPLAHHGSRNQTMSIFENWTREADG